LAKIPGIGPIGASLLVMKVAQPQAFRSGRYFAAWIGLTPEPSLSRADISIR
jgi:transposase